jgi:3-methyladenine DNA glycosylase AlkD
MAAPEELEKIVSQLKALAIPANISGMARFGINPNNTLGVSMPNIRQLGKGKKDHDLALALWETGIHEARILASIIDQPALMTKEQMDSWTADFDSWDVCDQVCGNLYSKSPLAVEKALSWSKSDQEFVKRAGFALMAYVAVHGKKVPDDVFMQFLESIEFSAEDGRNFVRKAVNWALRQIGKRGGELYQPALEVSRRLAISTNKTARWIGTDAVKELEAPSKYVKKRLGNQ